MQGEASSRCTRPVAARKSAGPLQAKTPAHDSRAACRQKCERGTAAAWTPWFASTPAMDRRAPVRLRRITRASFSIVGASARVATGSLLPNVRSISTKRLAARSDSPPRSKKSSFATDRWNARDMPAQILASAASASSSRRPPPGLAEPAGAVSERRQPAAIQLPVGRQRQSIQRDERRRDHVVGQATGAASGEARRRSGRAPGRPRNRRLGATRRG